MTALPRQDQLFDVPPDALDEQPTASRETAKQPKPRESDGVVAIYFELRGIKYKYQGAKDAEGWKRMRSVATVAEIEQRWRVGLQASGWNHIDTLAQLDQKWNELGALLPRAVVDGDDYPPCFICGKSAPTWLSKLRLCLEDHAGAMKVLQAVPLPSPPARSTADTCVREYQQRADLAVFEWAQKQKSNTKSLRGA